jgi:hypothetical protein
MRNNKFMPVLARFMAALMLAIAAIAPAQAAMMATESLVVAPASVDARAALADKLVSLGVTRADADARVAVLSNGQAAQVLQQADQLPAGADAVAVLGLIALILIVTDLLGITDVFPFIDKVGE